MGAILDTRQPRVFTLNHDGSMSQKEIAEVLDERDPLKHLRKEFIIPTKADLKRKTLHKSPDRGDSEECIYLCGNSLGLQPRRTRERVDALLAAWSCKGVTGHFVGHEDSTLPPFVDIDDFAARLMAPIVGAMESEVAVMATLTANLHLLMASFYRPTKEKYKIILEGKAFPSDHYAIESQIIHRGFDPKKGMIMLEPQGSDAVLSTEQILQTIDTHASHTALVLLPGIQFYTGQYFDIPTITRHAHSKGILIGWDCAHAVGNVDLKLHEWEVDFAVWCTYKYLNAGPGATAGLFVHERHGRVNALDDEPFRSRLSGWWGAEKGTRFAMNNTFVPRPGAAGYQLSNPSALDLSAVVASLEIFNEASMSKLRNKSLSLTLYLQQLLVVDFPGHGSRNDRPFKIITPMNPKERGAQLSIRLDPGLLNTVLQELEENGVVVDERKPDVIRVAPTPLYNTFTDVWNFVQIFLSACEKAVKRNGDRESTERGDVLSKEETALEEYPAR